VCGIVVYRYLHYKAGPSPLEQGSWEGETPVRLVFGASVHESSCLGLQLKAGGKFHRKLNKGGRPIAYKYREGKMQSRAKALLKSTWNCWKGSEGNQCQHGHTSLSACRWGAVSSLVQLDCIVRKCFKKVVFVCLLMVQSTVDEMVFFFPSWNTDQGV
jgi:hypothetical protein